MAASVEQLLEKLQATTEQQNNAWHLEMEKRDTRYQQKETRQAKEAAIQQRNDNFATEQQGQEVQLSKRNQMHTGRISKDQKLMLDDQGQLVEAGQPRWDKTSPVMTRTDAEMLDDSLVGIETDTQKLVQLETKQTDAQVKLEHDKKTTESKKAKTLEKVEEEKKETLRESMKVQKANLDKWVQQQAEFNNLTGAIKTDFSLVFGAMGALTRLPGIQTLLTGSRVILGQTYNFFNNILIPAMVGGLAKVGKGVKNLADRQDKNWNWRKKLARKTGFGKKSSYGGFRERIGRRFGLLEQKGTGTGKFEKGTQLTGKGQMFAALMKPLKFILNLFNPLKKFFWIAFVAIGGLLALFKGTDGKGLFAKLNTIWLEVKRIFDEKIVPAMKTLWTDYILPLWDIFVGDILPLLETIFEEVLWPLAKWIFPKIAWVFKKVFGMVYDIYMWLYDKIFKPIMRFFGWMKGTQPVAEMTETELRNESRFLGREEERGAMDEGERTRQKWVDDRLKELANRNTSGQEISDGARAQGDFNIQGGAAKLGFGSEPTMVAANSNQNIYHGPRQFVSRTDSSLIPASGMQGANIVRG